jgi:hypothetical protein
VQKLPEDLIAAVRDGRLPTSVADPLTGLKSDDEKHRFAQMYFDRQVTSGPELAAAIRARHGNGHAPRPTGFAGESGGVCFKVELAAGTGLAQAEAALRELVKELHPYRDRPAAEFQGFLDAKKAAAEADRKAAELRAALAGHTNGRPD